jgi:hypothetical protein
MEDDPQNTVSQPTAADLGFEDPDTFENFDDVEYDDVELPEDSFEFNTADFNTEGCGTH